MEEDPMTGVAGFDFVVTARAAAVPSSEAHRGSRRVRQRLPKARAAPTLAAMELGAERLSSGLEAVITRFRTMVRSVGARRGLSEADTDDLLQEVRVRLWRAGEAGKQLQELGASYVYRTAMSATVDVLRWQRTRGADVTESLDDRSERLLAGPADPHAQVETSELVARIGAAVDTLPLARRAVVRMYLTGYGREEIAELLGWTEAKTRNLLYRGLDDLRRCLAEWGITKEGIR
jgi:RNA polymerase sigma factor (sigma-70 family)